MQTIGEAVSEVPSMLKEGRYVVGEPLGDGGMASVYRCYDKLLDVERAIKVLKQERSTDAKSRARFVNEARLMSQLRHPGVVAVYDVVEDQGTVFMVMDIVEGGNLARRVNRYGPLPARMAVEAVCLVLEALEVAHEAGIVHRDVKPHNILLTAAGEPRLTDFGIARLVHQDDAFTRPGSAVGTWAYMAPEQRSTDGTVDGRADIYGCGATLFALITGTEPGDIFVADADSERYAPVPPALRPVLIQACEYEVSQRYATVADFKGALEGVVDALPAIPETTPPLPGVLLLEHDLLGNTEESEDEGADRFEAGEALDRHGVHRGKMFGKGAISRLFVAGGVGLVAGLVITIGLTLLFAYMAVRGNEAEVANVTPSANPAPVESALPLEEHVDIEEYVPKEAEPTTKTESAPADLGEEEVAAPPVPTVFGRIVVTTEPSSTLYIDGLEVGQTRYAGRVPAGSRAIRVVLSGGDSHSFDLDVIEGEVTNFCYDFELESECL
jgi:tRNA A-37 threonylcarbamoyl transferase component Bud32